MNIRSICFLTISILSLPMLSGQNSCYWQQEADHVISIKFDDSKHQYTGDETITYVNNSPDTLHHLYFYLFFNAFQPNSMMDIKSRTVADPDPRVMDRIAKLSPDEYGYQKVKTLEVDGKSQKFRTEETILEVELRNPILPGQQSEITLTFEAQVPLQIRRTGRDNKEGIDYSMSQWFPKLCEYDYTGWNAHPYVGREFHGIWGDYDVKIDIDSKYILGATGQLQNPNEIGYGYGPDPASRPSRHTWHFKAENVIDFMWAADPDYRHDTYKAYNGTEMHFFYQPGDKTSDNWALLPGIMDEALRYMNEHYGTYPYPVYSFIQGGDGGMEYPMATLITGERSLPSLVGVSVHEWMHSWYQMVLATNEARYPWMDEGFTSYATNNTMNHLRKIGKVPGEAVDNPMLGSVRGFANFAVSGMEEPLSTHGDHFITNTAYGTGSYTKGSLTLVQLGYIMGEDNLQKGLLRYFDEWKFKHPTPTDFFRVMEKVSGMELDWFEDYWVNTTHTIDYGIDTLEGNILTLSKLGIFPMPLDIVVTDTDGSEHYIQVPLSLTRVDKIPEKKYASEKYSKDWHWTHPYHQVQIMMPADKIKKVEIDPSGRLLDVDRSNNVYPKSMNDESK